MLPFIITFSPSDFSLKSLNKMYHLLIMCWVLFDSQFTSKFSSGITVIIILIVQRLKFRDLFKAHKLISGISEIPTQDNYKDYSSIITAFWPLISPC